MKKYKLTLTIQDNGFSVWATREKDRRWIIDASSILEDGSFRIDDKRCKKGKDKELSVHTEYTFEG